MKNKTAIITGAASGIGAATARLFAKEGAAVVLVDMVSPEKVASEIIENGGRALGLVADVSNSDSIQQVVKSALDTFNAIDIVINNAGISGEFGSVDQISEESFDRIFAVNVKAGFLLSKYTMPHLLKTKGVVLFTSSIAGLHGLETGLAYSASKGAIINLAKSIALDHARQGVRANVICPGATRTAVLESAPMSLEFFKSKLPQQKLVEPEDIAEGFLFLASSKARRITGQVLTIDSGFTAGENQLDFN